MYEEYLARSHAFKQAADQLLRKYETSNARVIELDATYSRLKRLSVHQDELFRESLRCVEQGLFRSAHVMAWAGFMDFLEESLARDGFVKLGQVRPKWRVTTVEELREGYPEHQIIEAVREVGMVGRSQAKTILGLLSKRNECGHPSDYFPGLNETLGFISELLARLERVRARVP